MFMLLYSCFKFHETPLTFLKLKQELDFITYVRILRGDMDVLFCIISTRKNYK